MYRTLASEQYRLSVNGSYAGNEEDQYAVYVQEDTAKDTELETQLGQLKVVTYDKEKQSVVIVPVNTSADRNPWNGHLPDTGHAGFHGYRDGVIYNLKRANDIGIEE